MKKIVTIVLLGCMFLGTSCAYKTCATYTKNDTKKEMKSTETTETVGFEDVRG